MKRLFTTVFLAVTLVAIPVNAKNKTPEVPIHEVIEAKAKDPLDRYIELLAFQESSGKENIDIIDTNGKHSRGCLQFQDATIKTYARKFNLPRNPLDCRYQKTLARQILLRGGWRNWLHSVQKLGGPEKIPMLHLQEASNDALPRPNTRSVGG